MVKANGPKHWLPPADWIVGVDPSLKACTFMVARLAPSSAADIQLWRPSTIGWELRSDVPELSRVRRLQQIQEHARRVSQQLQGKVIAAIEGYAYGRTEQAHSLGEAGGAVRLGLASAINMVGMVVIAPNTARSVLLEKVPRKGADAKAAVREVLQKAGAPRHWTLDATDAAAVVNAALKLSSLPHVGRGGELETAW